VQRPFLFVESKCACLITAQAFWFWLGKKHQDVHRGGHSAALRPQPKSEEEATDETRIFTDKTEENFGKKASCEHKRLQVCIAERRRGFSAREAASGGGGNDVRARRPNAKKVFQNL
jgi:hypothetical protein